jgi:hypothetical protein
VGSFDTGLPSVLARWLVRRGDISEIVGRLSSGRTSLFLACVAEVTGRGALAALVDADGALDPATAARAGIDLRRLLWVRCEGDRRAALRAADLLVRCPGFGLVGLDLGEVVPALSTTVAFRLKRAVRQSGSALVILGHRRLAGPGAAVSVETLAGAREWTGPGPVPTRLARAATTVHVLRARGEAALPGRVWWNA